MYTVIGSHAALHHRIIPLRKPKDWDIIATRQGVKNFLQKIELHNYRVQETPKGQVVFAEDGTERIVEIELVELSDNSADILDRICEDSGKNTFAPPDWLYFFKMSHRYRKDSPHFWKTRLDVEHMRRRGITMPINSEELFKERERLTYVNKTPILNQPSKTFFRKEDEFYVYDHDSIHEAIKIMSKPAYQFYMKDGAEVMTSKKKFFEVPELVRLLGVYEESCVLALERSLIPFDFKPLPEQAFKMALSKVCTSITGGWFREFGWENCLKIMDMYHKIGKYRYVEKFKEGLNSGIIKPFNKE